MASQLNSWSVLESRVLWSDMTWQEQSSFSSFLMFWARAVMTKMMKWSNALTSRINSNNVWLYAFFCIFLFLYVLLFICHQIPEVGMDQISWESVSRAFGGQDEADLSSHNYSMELEFSFDGIIDTANNVSWTSMIQKCPNTSDIQSEMSSPVFFSITQLFSSLYYRFTWMFPFSERDVRTRADTCFEVSTTGW